MCACSRGLGGGVPVPGGAEQEDGESILEGVGVQEESELLITRAEADVAEWCPHLYNTHWCLGSWKSSALVCVSIFVRAGGLKHIV